MFWTVTERLGLDIVQFLVSIILARLLDPSEFGLIGMLNIFLAISQSIMASGFGSALIQKIDADETDKSSIFYFNLVISIILATLLFLGAPIISQFYGQEILTPMTRVLSLKLIINAFGLIQTAILSKKLDFKNQMKIGLISAITSGVIGIFFAYRGYGVWSLVVQSLTYSFVSVILLWTFSAWKPSLSFSFSSLKSMSKLGSSLLITGLLNTFFHNFYNSFIGKAFSSAQLGFYSKATTISTAFTSITSHSILRVIFPALSPLQNEDYKLKDAFKKTTRLSMFLNIPMMIGLSIIANPLILVLLTEKWSQSIQYLQLLSFFGIFYSIINLNLNILKIKAKSNQLVVLQSIEKALIVLAIFISYRFGITFIIVGQLIVGFISFLLFSHISGRVINYGTIEQIKDITPILLKTILMGFSVFYFLNLNLLPQLGNLIGAIILGSLVYVLINLITKSEELGEILNIVKLFLTAFRIHESKKK